MNLNTLHTPALLLDLNKFEKNCREMKNRLSRLNVAIRPHLKTGKCFEFAKRQMTSMTGPATVSTLLEAEKFFDCGISDLIYAVGISPSKFLRVSELVKRGCDIKVILDNVETAEKLTEFCQANDVRIPVLIEIDCDGHRSGVHPDSVLLLEVAAALKGGARLVGVLTHAGDSYQCVGDQDCLKAQENERDSIVLAASRLKNAGHDIHIVSAGSTPTARFGKDWTGVTEVRCGVYCLQDLVMTGIGVCQTEDIALSLLVEVIGHQEEKGWIITDGGWMALSRDRGTSSQAVDKGYGLVCNLENDPIDDLIVVSANQEHGIVASKSGRKLTKKDFPVGTRLRILPNHACAMAAQHPQYFVVKGDLVTDVWHRFYGWQ